MKDFSTEEGIRQGHEETPAHSVCGFMPTSRTIQALSAHLQFVLTLALSGSQRQ